MTFPFGTPVTLIRRTTACSDAYGNDTYTETTSTVIGAFDPATGTESTDAMDQVSSQPTVYLPPGTDVDSIDAVDVDGKRYEVSGVANTWTSPYTGHQFGVSVPLKRVTG